jgi:hypothetical protein
MATMGLSNRTLILDHHGRLVLVLRFGVYTAMRIFVVVWLVTPYSIVRYCRAS